MAYAHDVFLSYSRANSWPRYVSGTFLPMLQHFLDEALEDYGSRPNIYVDVERIETGQAWPQQLAAALANSKVLLSLWSANYVKSPWCRAELAHMLARRQALTPGDGLPPSVVLVAVVGDGRTIDQKLPGIQIYPMQDLSNPWLASGTKSEMRLAKVVERLANHVAGAIQEAPEHDPTWIHLARDQFDTVFEGQQQEQDRPPSLAGVRL